MPGAVNDDAAGVLMLKPGVVASDQAMRELSLRLRVFGYEMVEVRTIEHEVVRDAGLLRRHYHDHFEVARVGRLLPEERARLMAIHDNDAFRSIAGDPDTIAVVPALALAARPGIGLSAIRAWSEQASARWGIDTGHPLACNEVGELADVQLLVDEQLVPDPIFVLNPQMSSLASWWEDGPDATVVARVARERLHPFTWAELRTRFLGTGPPERWPVGSVRRDMLDGTSALRYRDGIEMGVARNGVHLSNGPIEALREITVWFDRAPTDTSIGRALERAGIDVAAVLDAVYIDDATGVHALSGRTAHLDVPAVIEVLRGARLLRADEI